MSLLESWSLGSHTADGVTHPMYRKGSGPGVIVIHEVPGITPKVIAFAEEVVARGFTVVLPSLFGRPEAEATIAESVRTIARICVSREFSMFALGRTSPVTSWLRSLARELHAELGGPGVGAVGMCLTGGFALAMLADAPIAAPVLAQPATPAPVGRARRADLGLSRADLDAVKARVAAGCQVLGLRYERDPAVGSRFDTLRRELGDNFIAVEFPGRQHATLTEHRQQEGVDRVLAFFEQKLKVASDQQPDEVPARQGEGWCGAAVILRGFTRLRAGCRRRSSGRACVVFVVGQDEVVDGARRVRRGRWTGRGGAASWSESKDSSTWSSEEACSGVCGRGSAGAWPARLSSSSRRETSRCR